MTKDEMRSNLDKIAHGLGEHCESVTILVTMREDAGETIALDSGCGNFYARLGQIREWLAIQDQYQRNWARRNDGDESNPYRY